jgi:hypothetical protein
MSKLVPVSPLLQKALASVKSAVDAGKLPPSLLAGELGISGTTIWANDVQSESNAALIHQAAYGRAGSRAWGEWEKLLRTDEAVTKAVEFTKSQIRDARVDVKEASEDSDVPEAERKKHADFVRWNLLEALEPGWAEVSQQMCGGSLVNGFAVHEIVIAPCRHKLLPGGSGYRVAKLAERLPSSIHVNGWVEEEVPMLDELGAPILGPDGKPMTTVDLVAIKQWGPRAGKWMQLDLPADKVLLTTWNRSGNNYLGFSAFRSVWYLCRIREHLLRVLGIGSVREALGVPVAQMDKDVKLTPKSQRALQRFLANMVYHENASIVLPAGVKLEFLFSQGANKGMVLDAWKELGVHVLGQLQAQQMALGLSNTGSRSVGQIHDQVADAFALGVIANITGTINGTGQRRYTGLVRKLIDANFGPQPAYPTVTLTPRQAKLPADQFANAVKTMKDGGAITVWSHEDENNAREKAGLRLISQEDFDAAEQKKQESALKLAQQTAPGTEPDDGKPKPGFPPKPPAKARASAGWQPRRPLRASEQHLDLPGIVDFLDGGKERFERGVKPLVVEMLTRALPDVRTAMADGRIDNGELASVKLDTSRLEAFIGKFLAGCRAEGFRHCVGEMNRARKHLGASEEDDPAFPPPDPSPPDADPKTDQLLTAERKRLARKMAQRLSDALESVAIDVLRTGGEPEEVVSDVVADQVESKSLQSDAGSVMTRAFNMGREQFADEYGDQIDSAEISAVLDENTCDYCDSMDGTELEFGSSQEEALTPPLRQCEGRGKCRCIKVFNFKNPGFTTVDE